VVTVIDGGVGPFDVGLADASLAADIGAESLEFEIVFAGFDTVGDEAIVGAPGDGVSATARCDNTAVPL